jgi:hypothetical protein
VLGFRDRNGVSWRRNLDPDTESNYWKWIVDHDSTAHPVLPDRGNLRAAFLQSAASLAAGLLLTAPQTQPVARAHLRWVTLVSFNLLLTVAEVAEDLWNERHPQGARSAPRLEQDGSALRPLAVFTVDGQPHQVQLDLMAAVRQLTGQGPAFMTLLARTRPVAGTSTPLRHHRAEEVARQLAGAWRPQLSVWLALPGVSTLPPESAGGVH